MRTLIAVAVVAALAGCQGKSESQMRVDTCYNKLVAVLKEGNTGNAQEECGKLTEGELTKVSALFKKSHPDHNLTISNTPNPVPAPVVAKPDKTLGMQPTAFVGRINEAFKDIDIKARAENCKVSNGEKRDAMQCKLIGASDAGFVIMLNKEDQSAREVMFALANSSKMELVNSLLVISAAVQAVDSEKARKSSGDWLTALLKKAAGNKEQSASTVVNGFEYSISFPEGLGLWFVISSHGKNTAG